MVITIFDLCCYFEDVYWFRFYIYSTIRNELNLLWKCLQLLECFRVIAFLISLIIINFLLSMTLKKLSLLKKWHLVFLNIVASKRLSVFLHHPNPILKNKYKKANVQLVDFYILNIKIFCFLCLEIYLLFCQIM